MRELLAGAMLIGSVATAVAAELQLEQWQKDALVVVKEYSRVRDAAWQDARMLYLWAYDDNIDWDNIADQVTCNHLVSAGMPANSKVMVVFYENAAALQGNAVRLGRAFCD